MVQKIRLAAPRGFCAGVDRAIDIVDLALEAYGTPLYVRHEIVHNKHVVQEFKEKGVVFVDELSEVPSGSTVIFSAHGIPPKVREEARQRNLKAIDATCPLVTKVHVEARRFYNKGYTILLIGHKGHQEVIGTMGNAPMTLVESVKDAQDVEVVDPEKVVYLTQTTLSLDETREIVHVLKQRFPKMTEPAKEDICYATTNRQNAVKELAKECDLILVIGSKNSSNSNRLRDRAVVFGTQAYLIDDATELDDAWLEGVKTLGITSGASAPDTLVQDLVAEVKRKYPDAQVSTNEVIKESVEFLLPPELRA